MPFSYHHHPHLARRKPPGKITDELPRAHWYQRVNTWIALKITLVVGSMWCAYAFGLLAVSGLPAALKPGNIGLLFWISSDFLQLTLLSVIIVGQNIQARAADKRAESTYKDAEALLHETAEIQRHLTEQDKTISGIEATANARD